jgi:CRP/FNR family transcriptional regulator, cyclic AMP receptor protein
VNLFNGGLPLLDTLRAEDRDELLRNGMRRRFHKGDVLLLEGDRSSMVFVITGGWVMVSSTSDEGRRVVLAFRGPGDIVGELAALDAYPRSATVTALGDVVTSVLTAEVFRLHLATMPAFNAQIIRTLGSRLRDADSHRRELATLPVLQRLCRLLIRLAGQGGTHTLDGVVVEFSLAQHDLAAAIGATRETTAKALGVLRERGLIQTGRRLTVLHEDVLRRIADF